MSNIEWTDETWTPVKGCTRASEGCDNCYACGTTDNTCSNALRHIHWVIVGGESGPGARPCLVAWIRSIVRQCRDAGVPCFVKQLGAVVQYNGCGLIWPEGTTKHDIGGEWRVLLRDKKGGDPAEWPEDLRVREMPEAKGGGDGR